MNRPAPTKSKILWSDFIWGVGGLLLTGALIGFIVAAWVQP
jgi:hypothetical protein